MLGNRNSRDITCVQNSITFVVCLATYVIQNNQEIKMWNEGFEGQCIVYLYQTRQQMDHDLNLLSHQVTSIQQCGSAGCFFLFVDKIIDQKMHQTEH